MSRRRARVRNVRWRMNARRKRVAWITVTDAALVAVDGLTGRNVDEVILLDQTDWRTGNSQDLNERCTLLRTLIWFQSEMIQDGAITQPMNHHLMLRKTDEDAPTPLNAGFIVQDFMNDEDILWHHLHAPNLVYNVDTAPTQLVHADTSWQPWDITNKRVFEDDNELRLFQTFNTGTTSSSSGMRFTAVYRMLIQLG